MRERLAPLAAVLILTGCAKGAEAPAHDAVLITIDTWRADAAGFAGNERVETPNLDGLAARGRVFANAHAHSVTTLPSHASILTALYPHEHGARHNGSHRLGDGSPTLAAVLRDAGFRTAAFVAAFPVEERFGLARGFEVYDDELEDDPSPYLFAERPAPIVVERALDWWHRHDGERRFLWIHLFEPHAPYASPEPFRSHYEGNPYLGEVAAVDAALAPLFEALADSEGGSLVTVTSDHGEAFGEHDEIGHGLFAYETTLRVPLVLQGPRVEIGTDERWARHVDLMPTILDGVGIEAPAGLSGTSLFGPREAHPTQSHFEALSANLDYGWAPLRGVLLEGRKLIELPLPELYDLRADPGEETNLVEDEPDLRRRLARRLPEETLSTPLSEADAEATRERLAALGYLGGRTVDKEEWQAEDDPKTLIDLDRGVEQLRILSIEGRVSEAVDLALRILGRRPTMGLVYIYLTDLLLTEGRESEVVDVVLEARAHGVTGPELEERLGLAFVHLGRTDDAIAVLEPLADSRAAALDALAIAYSQSGDPARARRLLEEALETDPNRAETWENLSFVELAAGRTGGAVVAARRAVELDPLRLSAWNNLGVAHFREGELEEAREAWLTAASIEPDDPDTLFNLAAAALEDGDRDSARRHLERFLEVARGTHFEPRRARAAEIFEQIDDGQSSIDGSSTTTGSSPSRTR